MSALGPRLRLLVTVESYVSSLLLGWQSATDAAAAEMVEMLTALFGLVNSRSVYLHCLADDDATSQPANRTSLQPADATQLLGLFTASHL